MPGEASAFGPGFWRRLRATGGGGCMLGFFLLVGSAIFLFGLAGTAGPWKEGLRANGDPRFFLAMMGFGTVFGLFALRMLQLALTGAENEGRRKNIDRKRPWTSDHPWQPEGQEPDYTRGGGSVLGRVAFLAFIGMLNMVFVSPSPWLIRGVVILFDAFGLLILWDSLHQIWQRLRHGRARMRWTTFPAFLGGTIEGVFSIQPPLHARGPVKAILRCLRDEYTAIPGRHGKDQPTLEAFIIYQQTRQIDAGEGPLQELPLFFDIPKDLPATQLRIEQAFYWQVVVLVPVNGPDFQTVFLAPVYAGS